MQGTGIRKGELCGITFDSINIDKRELYINTNVIDIDIKTLQETLGYSNSSVTLDTYSHGYIHSKVKQADMLDDTIFSKNKFVI